MFIFVLSEKNENIFNDDLKYGKCNDNLNVINIKYSKNIIPRENKEIVLKNEEETYLLFSNNIQMNSQFYLKLERNTTRMKDIERGLFLWIIENGKINIDNNKNLLLSKNFKGLGLRIGDISINGIFNNGIHDIEEQYFNGIFSKKDKSQKYFNCLSAEKEINLKFTLIKNNIFTEILEGDTWELCYVNEFDSTNISLMITSNLINEEIKYKITNYTLCELENSKKKQLTNDEIIMAKLEMLEFMNTQLNEVSDTTSEFNYKIIQKQSNRIQELQTEKLLFNIEVIDDVLNKKISERSDSLEILDENKENLAKNNNINLTVLNELLYTMVNLSFQKNIYTKDSREQFILYINKFREHHSKMNHSLYEIESNFKNSSKKIENDSKRIKKFRIYELIMFCLIIITSLYLYVMIKNYQEKEREMEKYKNMVQLKLAV
jgi:hypothetical protein